MTLEALGSRLANRFAVARQVDARGNSLILDHYHFGNWVYGLGGLHRHGEFQSLTAWSECIWGPRHPAAYAAYCKLPYGHPQNSMYLSDIKRMQANAKFYLLGLAAEGFVAFSEVIRPHGSGSATAVRKTDAGCEFYLKNRDYAKELKTLYPAVSFKLTEFKQPAGCLWLPRAAGLLPVNQDTHNPVETVANPIGPGA